MFPLPQAILQDLLPPAYVFITLGWFSDNWWDPANEMTYNLSSSCSKEQMERALHMSLSIATDSAPSNNTTPTISGLVRSISPYMVWVFRLCNSCRLGGVYWVTRGLAQSMR